MYEIMTHVGNVMYIAPFFFSMNRTSVYSLWMAGRNSFFRLMYGWSLFESGEFMILMTSYFSTWIYWGTVLFAKNLALNYYYQNYFLDFYSNRDFFLTQPFGFGANSQKLIMLQFLMLVAIVLVQIYYYNHQLKPGYNFARSMFFFLADVRGGDIHFWNHSDKLIRYILNIKWQVTSTK